MSPVTTRARVGEDGVLTLRVPLGRVDAGAEVLVTVEPLRDKGPESAVWQAFVLRTAGSVADADCARQPQGIPERRESL